MFSEKSTVISDIWFKWKWKPCEDRSNGMSKEPGGLWGHLGKRKWGAELWGLTKGRARTGPQTPDSKLVLQSTGFFSHLARN